MKGLILTELIAGAILFIPFAIATLFARIGWPVSKKPGSHRMMYVASVKAFRKNTGK